MVEKTLKRDPAGQPSHPCPRTDLADNDDDCQQRQHGKKREAKSQRQEMMYDEADECQLQQPGQ